MKEVIIYHNPRCSKSRQALQILEEHHIKPTIIEYLKTPPTPKTIAHLLTLLGITPRDLMRKNETLYKELKLDEPTLSNADLIGVMAEHPILIERPIVITNQKAIIARPPEKVLELIK